MVWSWLCSWLLSLWLIVLILMSNWKTSAAIRVDDFYPFGLENGDSQLKKTDDENNESVLDIPFNSAFEFFGQQHTFVNVLTNGLLSLSHSDVTSTFSPTSFPTRSNRILIAPFWADVDTRGTGSVYYRTTVNETHLNKMNQDINNFFNVVFSPVYLFISTWYKVGYFSKKTDKTNTFQCILATDHESSFIIFLYEEGGIQWAAGEQTRASNSEGFATVGFDAGDGEHYVNVLGSNTKVIINISSTSNVGIPGIWAFQVNSAQITDPCDLHPCHLHANCTQTGLTNDFICTCIPPYYGNGTICKAASSTTTNGTTTDSVFVITDGTTTEFPETFLGNETWAVISVFLVLVLLFLLLLPGAVYGYVRVTMFILSDKKELFKDPSSSSKAIICAPSLAVNENIA